MVLLNFKGERLGFDERLCLRTRFRYRLLQIFSRSCVGRSIRRTQIGNSRRASIRRKVRKDINTDSRASNQLVWKKADFRSVKEVFGWAQGFAKTHPRRCDDALCGHTTSSSEESPQGHPAIIFVGQRDNFTASSALYILVMNGVWRDGRCMITLDS